MPWKWATNLEGVSMKRNRIFSALFGGMLILLVGAAAVLAGEPDEGPKSSPAPDWLVDYVDATRQVGYFVSAATDRETGHTYISYYEGDDGDLWLARTGAPTGNCGPSNTWECQVLDSDGIVGKYSSITVGGRGQVAKLYISYHDVTTGSLKVVKGEVDRATGALTYSTDIVELGDPGLGYYYGTRTAVACHQFVGMPHIAYQIELAGDKNVRYANRANPPGTGNCGEGNAAGEWQCSHIHGGAGVGDFLDIYVENPGTVHMAFFTAEETDTFPIWGYRVGTGGWGCNGTDQWICHAINHPGNDTGEYLSLGITSITERHLAYRNATTESVEWATYALPEVGNCGTSNWYQCEGIDDIGSGAMPSGIDIEIDDGGHPIIAYQDVNSGYFDLKIARPLEALPWGPAGNCGPLSPTFFPTWLCETLDAGDLTHAHAVGGLSIAMNADGEAAVAYRELFDPISTPEEGRLRVAVEPVTSIFFDGFEWGNTSAWSSAVP